MGKKELMICLSTVAVLLTCIVPVGAESILLPWQGQNDMEVVFHGGGGAAVGENIYAVGGNTTAAPNGTAVVQKYNTLSDTWLEVAAMPTARHSFDCAVVDGWIYAIGGHVGNSRSENERYNPSTDQWTDLWDDSSPLEPKPTAVCAHGVAAFGGKIYTFGGLSYGSYQSVIEVYDPSTNAWKSVGNMPAAGEPWRAATLGDKIYLAGGLLGSDTDLLWAYDPLAAPGERWDTNLPRLNVGRQGHELVAVGNYLFAIGGSDASGSLNSVEWWTPGATGWTLDESLNVGRGYFGAEEVGNTIYAFGGNWPAIVSTESAFVPEPATLGLLLMVAGLALLRRRRGA